MARKKGETVPTFDDGAGFTVSADEGKDAGHKVRGWAERFRHPNSGAADDSEETTQRYLEAYATAADMDRYNGMTPQLSADEESRPIGNDDDGA